MVFRSSSGRFWAVSGTRIIIRFEGKYAEILLKANQQRTVLILNLRHQIGYEGISLLAVGSCQLAVASWQLPVGRRKKKIFLIPYSFFLLLSSLFLLPSS